MTSEEIFLSTPVAACWGVRGPAKNNEYVKPKEVLDLVCQITEIPFEDMKHKTRKREIAQARQIAMVMLHYYSSLSLNTIGCMFGHRDHTTVIYAKKTVNDLIDSDANYKNLIGELQEKLNQKCCKQVFLPGVKMENKKERDIPPYVAGIIQHIYKRRSLKEIIRNA